MSNSYRNAHIAWLACLGALLRKVRSEGLMSIESEIETPEAENTLFRLFPQVLEAPYLEFATDILRMMVGGTLEADELQVYVDHYIAGLTAKRGVDESLLRAIWLTLWASMKGYAPQVACEFGRQAIPLEHKPSFAELEQVLRDSRDAWRQRGNGEVDLDAAIADFMASLEA